MESTKEILIIYGKNRMNATIRCFNRIKTINGIYEMKLINWKIFQIIHFMNLQQMGWILLNTKINFNIFCTVWRHSKYIYPFSYGMIFKRVDQLCMFQRSWNNLMALEHFIVEGLLMLIVNSCGVLLNIIRYWFRTLW